MSSFTDTASTYSYASSSSTYTAAKAPKTSTSVDKQRRSTSRTQALKTWTKQLVADIGHPPTYRYDKAQGPRKPLMAYPAGRSSLGGPFYNVQHSRL
ncbi:hypothetical protein SPI_02249 [Niveomyces insectorum RCEF 264]|uniref:Uncharacterized protein n=1 Tax=Niveomyces insectorum RCEF 264 TaxID=1081102 RepID=A0A162J8W3_9HYPO|nr:hypothetical protein SPI_02249 [Niveomyces insectorum RCEF 264]